MLTFDRKVTWHHLKITLIRSGVQLLLVSVVLRSDVAHHSARARRRDAIVTAVADRSHMT